MNDLTTAAPLRGFAVRDVPPLRPLDWLARGGRDLLAAPGPGLAHGVALALAGGVIAWIFRERFWLLVGSFSGFLLVAPLAATGLYAISRAIERGERATLATAAAVWRPERRLVVFGLLLALAGTGWVLTSAALITRFAPAPIATPADFVRHVVLAERGWLFEAWQALGALMAVPVFASSAVAIPLLLDRPGVGVLDAVLTSWRTVLANPAAMALWGALLLGLTLFGFATGLLGLVVAAPWTAHATWHAYRDLVPPASAATPRRGT